MCNSCSKFKIEHIKSGKYTNHPKKQFFLKQILFPTKWCKKTYR